MSGNVIGSAVYEIGIDDSKFNTGLQTAERTAQGSVSTISSIGSKLAVFGLAVGGVKELTGAISGFISDALESQRVSAQTEAVIKSTGGAAGLSAQQVADLATNMSKVVPFDDETIQSAENLLLTFTSIGKDVFPDATQAALDMATTFKTGPEEAAKTLGKALNDPIGGISALSRVGVQFTDQQKEQIKAMVEAGDTAGAQQVILAELAKETGGSATAAGKTFAGQMTILNTRIGNLKEQIGMALIPVLFTMAGAFGKVLDKAQPIINFLSRHMKPTLIGIAAALTVLVVPALYATATAMGAAVVAALPVIAIAAAIGLAAVALYEAWSHNFLGIQGITETIVDFVKGHLQLISDALLLLLGPLGLLVIAWQNDWGGIRDFISGVVDAISLLFHGKWSEAWDKLTSVVGDAKDHLINETLPNLWSDIQTFFTDTLPKIGAALLEWGAAFVSWVAPQIPPLLLELGKLLLSLGDWVITTALPEVGKKLAEWAAAFIAWVAPQIPPLLLELGKLLLALGKWTLEVALPEVVKYVGKWGKAFLGWIGDETVGFLKDLPGELAKILTAIGTWMGDAGSGAIKFMVDKGLELGGNLLKGIASGVTDFVSNGLDAALQLLTDHIPGWAKKLLGISSPSKVMMPIGSQVAGGVAQGILDGIPLVSEALGQMGDAIGSFTPPALVSGGIGNVPPLTGGIGNMPPPGTSGGIGNLPPVTSPPTSSTPPSSGGGTSIQAAAARLERARNQLTAANQRLQAAFATGDPVQIAQMQYLQQQAILEYQAALAAYQAAVLAPPATTPPSASLPTPAPPTAIAPPWQSNPLDTLGPTGGAYQGAGAHKGGAHRRGGSINVNLAGRTVEKIMTDLFGNVVTRTLT